MTIAACLIVKDAIDTIEACLASVRPHVDEVDVYDTGSTDGTFERLLALATQPAAAHEAPVRVERGEWRSDFAWARSKSFALASPGTEWLLWLDADDVLEGGEWLRPLIAEAPADIDGFAFYYDYARDADGNTLVSLWRERIVRRSAEYRWVGRVHEILRPPEGRPSRIVQVPQDRISIVHNRSNERVDAWGNRNLPLLLREIEDAESAGRTPEPGTALNLALESKFRGDHERAAAYFERVAFEPTYPPHVRRTARVGLASCLRITGAVERAIKVAQDGLDELGPGPDLGFELTKAFDALEDWDAVEQWAEYSISTPVPAGAFVPNRLELTVGPMLYLAGAQLARGATAKATDAFVKAASCVKGDFLPGKLESFEGALRDEDLRTARVILREARAHYDEDLKDVVRGLRFAVEESHGGTNGL